MAILSQKKQLIKINQVNLDNKKIEKRAADRIARMERLGKFILFHHSSGEKRKKIYEQFLNSELWDDRKTKLFGEYNKACEICSSEKVVQVHHNNYMQILGEERNKDLTILCRDCHNLFHSKSHVKDPSKHKGNGYWHKGHYRVDINHVNRHCSMCSCKAKYLIFRESRERHILFCQSCIDIFKCKLDGNTGEELRTKMPITVVYEGTASTKDVSTVRRRRNINH